MKEKGEYTKRNSYTVAPFPELNSEALGFVYRMLTTGIGHQEFINEQEKRHELAELINKKDFIKLYTFAQIETAGSLNRESLQGEWMKYDQGSDYHILENSLRGKGTGWCTAEGSAASQLQHGDFYVYYSRGNSGTYSEPRIAICMDGDQVAEVRGVNHRQELEPALIDIATEKYHSLPGGEKFDKKSADMKKMTELVKKQEKGEQFNKDELIFLYELNAPIEYFGYDKDPRIEELRDARDTNADLPIFFDCVPGDVAHSFSEIKSTTKAYVGKLEPEIFNMLPQHVEYVYTEFPGEQIKFYKNIKLGIEIKNGQEEVDLVDMSLHSLGFEDEELTRYEYICKRAFELGLALCPAEVGPLLDKQLRVDEKPGPLDWLRIAISTGSPNDYKIFVRDSSGNEAFIEDAGPDWTWDPESHFVFLRPRK